MVFAAPVAQADDEIQVQATGDGQRVAVFQTHSVVHLLPKRAARFAAHVTRTPELEVVREQLPVESQVMPGKRFFCRATTEVFADLQLPAVEAPVIMTLLAVPPGVHPITAQRPAAAQVELRSDIRHQGHVVEQVCFQRHVEGFAGRDNRAKYIHRVASDDLHRVPVLYDNGIARRGDRFRAGSILPPGFNDDEHSRGAQFREEALFHVTPRLAAVQHAQLTLAAIHDLALTDNELGSMIQYLQHFVPVGHIGGFDQGGEPFPVHATGFDIESVTFQRNPLFQVRPDSRGTAFRQAPVDFRGTLRGSPGNDANRSNLEGGITPKRGQTAGERVQAGAVVPEQGIQTRVTLAEINLDADRVTRYRLPGHRRPGGQ